MNQQQQNKTNKPGTNQTNNQTITNHTTQTKQNNRCINKNITKRNVQRKRHKQQSAKHKRGSQHKSVNITQSDIHIHVHKQTRNITHKTNRTSKRIKKQHKKARQQNI